MISLKWGWLEYIVGRVGFHKYWLKTVVTQNHALYYLMPLNVITKGQTKNYIITQPLIFRSNLITLTSDNIQWISLYLWRSLPHKNIRQYLKCMIFLNISVPEYIKLALKGQKFIFATSYTVLDSDENNLNTEYKFLSLIKVSIENTKQHSH